MPGVIRRLRLLLEKGEVQQRSVSINTLVTDVLELIHNDLVTQNVVVDTQLAQNLPTVTGDPVQLQQVLLNLVINACDAMNSCKTSERRLLISTGIGKENGAVIVSVSDRGEGIHEEDMERVFEPFFTTKEKGMGLGSSVCRTIVAAHRGKLWATNNRKCGATFCFTLPTVASSKSLVTNHNGLN